MKLIQFTNGENERHVGIVDGDTVIPVTSVATTYDLFNYAEERQQALEEAANKLAAKNTELNYRKLAEQGHILPPVDHPDPYHLWVTGTGLTHLGSAESRDAMHQKLADQEESELTDSMRMFRKGLEDGKMEAGEPASQPEWFYKGNGLTVVSPYDTLGRPSFAMDGGEEPEIAGLYIISPEGEPRRLGVALANEFSDHKMEQTNYLQLAHSKLRPCSFGPELLVGELPNHIVGRSRIWRDGEIHWEKEFLTGEDNMTHNIANLEHHHFKYELFRQPGDVHVHMFGTSVLSFADGIEPREGDLFEMEADCFDHPLRNRLSVQDS